MGGDSAGGNLAAAITLRDREEGAHFLSDTVVGLALGFTCVIVIDRLVFRKAP